MQYRIVALPFFLMNSPECFLQRDEESKRKDIVFLFVKFVAADPLLSHLIIIFSLFLVLRALRRPFL
jgi:hypothetical protein